ncbi:MAG: hypothetical protein J6I40_07845 [Mailhella sp.]|nr:hypothetical protein [Mailhella sp.]
MFQKPNFGMIVLGVISALTLGLAAMWGLPRYSVYQQGLAGEAELARAQQNRQIRIQEAMAAKESAKMLAEAEIERAKGVAEANKIIGDSLKGNEAYLRYLWVQGLNSAQTPQVVYVPTEAGLPIMEAGRTNGK